ncbi:hypothetical protein FB451DRAFT_1207927 [Mycena latifolia]|nr:hypothetical protein FB451DRAFT_1207927 [Mycena latifolia]
MVLGILGARFIIERHSTAQALSGPTVGATCGGLHPCRQLFDIICGCLATIFASTWISVHLNVPSPGHSWLRLTFKRLGMMVVAAVAPEVIVYFAARQWFVAREFSKEYGVSKTHGFFFSMGGFVSRVGNHPITTIHQLQDPLFGAEYLAAIRTTDVEDIMDKSKGDAFSKGIAFLQALWFIIQCIARAVQRLPVTQLEIATLAFAVVNVFTWLLWWNKPLDVTRPILIGPTEEQFAEKYLGSTYSVSTRTLAPVHTQAFNSLLVGPVSGDYPAYNPNDATAVPTFWSSSDPNPYAMWIEAGVGMVFGAIHCTSWNVNFPSSQEQSLWRWGSALIATLPAMIGCSILTDTTLEHLFSDSWNDRSAVRFMEALLSGPFVAIGLPMYIICRVMLLILPLITLRGLPPTSFLDIDWTAFIPHF